MEQTMAAAGENRLAVQFVGSGSEYFRIWIVNLLLTLLTLGLYYPYAKVRRLRYFYGATEVGGQPLAFHAEPARMLRGYLLVGAMLVAYSVAGQVSPWAGLVAFCILAGLWPALWHSSLRFRLANTGWRGLRFRFEGSRSGAYAALAPAFLIALPVVAMGVLGAPSADSPADAAAQVTPAVVATALLPIALLLGLPAMLWWLRRYQHRHYALAAEQTGFFATLGSFYSLALRAAGLMLVLGVAVGLAAALLAGALGSGSTGDPLRGAGLASLFVLGGMLMGVVGWQAVVRPYFTARMQNLVWNGTRSRHLRFDSQLRYRPLLWLSLKNWLLMLVTLGLYFPFATIDTARLRLQSVAVLLQGDADALVATRAPGEEAAAGDAAGDMLGLDIGL